MPEVFRMFGIRFFFYSNEHLPLHIHAENSDGIAKFSLLPTVQLLSNKGMKPADIRVSKEAIEKNKTEIINEWNKYHGKLG